MSLTEEKNDAQIEKSIQILSNVKNWKRFRRIAGEFANQHLAFSDMLSIYERFGHATRMPKSFMVSSE